ncbi:hypothetical protein SAMN05444321_6782 [Bradyrhizobium lablabi]|nr:hypothetical protein SAMN05444321_6782 [Bradyrhizobium lablabi]
MRKLSRVILWLVAALYCAITTVVFAYITAFIAALVFRFNFIESHTTVNWLYGSMALFASLSCVFLVYIAHKMEKGDL